FQVLDTSQPSAVVAPRPVMKTCLMRFAEDLFASIPEDVANEWRPGRAGCLSRSGSARLRAGEIEHERVVLFFRFVAIDTDERSIRRPLRSPRVGLRTALRRWRARSTGSGRTHLAGLMRRLELAEETSL